MNGTIQKNTKTQKKIQILLKFHFETTKPSIGFIID
jgi:hypothetical protein